MMPNNISAMTPSSISEVLGCLDSSCIKLPTKENPKARSHHNTINIFHSSLPFIRDLSITIL